MNYDDLKQAYPRLIPENFVFECETGWAKVIEPFFATAERKLPRSYTRLVPRSQYLSQGRRLLGHDWCLIQVNEKFGGLRIYYALGNGVIDEAIEAISAAEEMAEARAMHTCEMCGKPGMLRQGSYLQTLCDEHAVEPGKQKPRPRVDGVYRRKGGDGTWYMYDPALDRMTACGPPAGQEDLWAKTWKLAGGFATAESQTHHFLVNGSQGEKMVAGNVRVDRRE